MIQKLKSHPITKWLSKNGWSYHKHQIDTLEEVTKGYDILLVAPTGGGKTLAGEIGFLVLCILCILACGTSRKGLVTKVGLA